EETPELATVIRANLAAWMGQRHQLRHVLGQPRPGRWCTFSPDGKVFVTASSDGVRCWETATGRTGGPALKEAHMTALALSPDGKTILTASSAAQGKPGRAQRWDTVTGKSIGEPLPHPGPIECVAFTPDGKHFVTGCNDGVVRLWDNTGRLQSERFLHE